MVFVFLGIVFEKKYVVLTLILYILYLILTLLTGVRGEFVIGIFVIVFYLFIYQTKIIKENIISKKQIIIACAFIPIIIILLNIYNTTRNNNEVSKVNLVEQFNDFFSNQGGSVNLISITQQYKEELTNNKSSYTFGPVINSVQSKLKKVDDNFKIENIEYRKNSLAKELSIIVLGQTGYDAGQGVGSQYIAEIYIDYGYVGIIIFNSCIGIIIYLLSNCEKGKYIRFSLSLLLIQSILYIPRGQALQFINALLSANYWIMIGIISILIYFENLCSRRYRLKDKK
jgi:oligosaccharide repeat unit polymerase